jgi:hypothetical protein
MRWELMISGEPAVMPWNLYWWPVEGKNNPSVNWESGTGPRLSK